MFRHLLRAMVCVVVAGSALLCGSAPAHAQLLGGGTDLLSDPFSFYYAIYLPNQQLQALRPRPSDALNQVTAQRQYYSQMDRRALYNPISGQKDQSYDPLHPYSGQNQERMARPFRFSQDPSNLDGTGPSLYYGRATTFFPGLRAGRGLNANNSGRTSRALSTPRALNTRGGGGGGGFGGMGGMGGMGMGGMGMGGMGGMM